MNSVLEIRVSEVRKNSNRDRRFVFVLDLIFLSQSIGLKSSEMFNWYEFTGDNILTC